MAEGRLVVFNVVAAVVFAFVVYFVIVDHDLTAILFGVLIVLVAWVLARFSRPRSASEPEASTPQVEAKPLAATVLVAMGGVLVVLEGLLYGEVIVLLTGLFLFVMAFLVQREPHHHVATGVVVFVLVFMSLIFGYGGFYAGAVLAAVGGILAVVWTPPLPVLITEQRAPAYSSAQQPPLTVNQPPANQNSPPPPPSVIVNVQQAPTPPQIMRRCQHCGTVYPEVSAKCPSCGAPF